MGNYDVKQIIKDIIELVAPDANITNIRDDVGLREQLELDSMDFLDIVMELRKKYQIEVPKEEYGELASLDSCVAYLQPKFDALPRD